MQEDLIAYFGNILDFRDNPIYYSDAEKALRYFPKSFLLVRNGRIVGIEKDVKHIKNTKIIDYKNKLILPGFIDTHCHYPQIEAIVSYGKNLLEWLKLYIFPVEERFCDQQYAKSIAKFFLRELFCNGTTTALVFATSHKVSVEAIFAEALKQKMCLISGKVLMDRLAPKSLLSSLEQQIVECEDLITKYHKKERIFYALSPRFALTSSEKSLRWVGERKDKTADLFLQTHLAENKDEIAQVEKIFPSYDSYLHLYRDLGLLGKRSVFAHCIHLSRKDFSLLAKSGSAIAHCPSSNLFLGSGLFNFKLPIATKYAFSIGSDVAGGQTFSLLKNLSHAYQIAALQKATFSSFSAYYWLTLGAARAIGLEDQIGSFTVGHFADFVIVDPNATALMKFRNQRAQSLHDLLFATMMLADERAIVATYIAGKAVHLKD